MDLIDPILSAASEIYSLVERVKANKKRCRRVSDRVRALEELLRSAQRCPPGQADTEQVEAALSELSFTLASAQAVLQKYAQANWAERVLKSSGHGDDFSSVNERLSDGFQLLSAALQLQHRMLLQQAFSRDARQQEDEDDRREDDQQLKEMLLDFMRQQQQRAEAMWAEFTQLRTSMETLLLTMDKPRVMDEAVRVIRADEISYDLPKLPFMSTASSQLFRGRYHGFSVAVKKYREPANTNPREVRSIFSKEVETMKRFECPNILRVFGICVQEDEGPLPQFLIIMEYCEKGSLRQVLDSDCQLSWTDKARMCRDAALGLYRLHQTEEQSKVHGYINSSKFLVAEGYTVKLGGFELSKTETSLRKKTSPRDTEIRSLCYSSPQRLHDINHSYSKECEIYSFGIVMWEIATRQRPFQGCSDSAILLRVCEQREVEALPPRCPAPLTLLINACRAYDSFMRPSAGVLVDRLHSVVSLLENGMSAGQTRKETPEPQPSLD